MNILSTKKNDKSTGTTKRKEKKISWKEQRELMLIGFIPFVAILIFCYLPIYGIAIAFQDYIPGAPIVSFDGRTKWVGLKHFMEFISSSTFPRLIRNTLVLNGLNLAFGFTLPIVFALVLNEVKSLKYKKVVQTASYLPYFLSTVIVAGMMLAFFDSNGLVNKIREILGLPIVVYNMNRKAFPTIYTIANVWKKFGWDSILYLSAMSAIDTELYEAAKVEGANRAQRMWYITLPCIKPTIMLLLIFAIGSMLASNTELILLLYNPATYETADVIGTYVYRDSLLGGRFSFGTAVGLFSSILNFALIFLANKVSAKVADYSLW